MTGNKPVHRRERSIEMTELSKQSKQRQQIQAKIQGLELNRETIQDLSELEAEAAQGGALTATQAPFSQPAIVTTCAGSG
jgi:hypothetical protein